MTVLAAAFLFAAPALADTARKHSPETSQSLVVQALQRAKVDLAQDACLIGAEVHMGCGYTAGVGWGRDRKDVEYYFDNFSFWFKSPRQQWYQEVSRCDAAGDYGMDQPNCLQPLGVWSSRDRRPAKNTPNGTCLSEMSFDSDKAAEAAVKRGVSHTSGCYVHLYLRTMESKAKKFAPLKGKTFWVATDSIDTAQPRKCVAFSAVDGQELYYGPCTDLVW
ncbi:MAG: hypothetical protein HY925_09695 [Elusimicrobia bacterium]|nr:hypothetical protein [Elusimicrobiota bacterium]